VRAFYQAQARRRLRLYDDDSDSTTDLHTAYNSDNSGPEDLDVVSNREGDAIRNNTLEPGKSGNAGERRTESATVLASPGRDVSLAGQLAPRALTIEVSDDPMCWTIDKVA
jgi:hypothetical protein